MSEQKIDGGKRTWLIASSCAGAVGAGFVAVPFVKSFQPSERARAAGAAVEVDISGIKPGEKLTVEWRGKPVWVVRRTPEQLAELPKLDSQLADPKSKRNPDELTPEYARNENRSVKPEYLVVVGICLDHHEMRALLGQPIRDQLPHPAIADQDDMADAWADACLGLSPFRLRLFLDLLLLVPAHDEREDQRIEKDRHDRAGKDQVARLGRQHPQSRAQ